jgi:histidine ammonia-lyase
MNKNLAVILGIEAMCAAQGVQARAPLQTSSALQKAIDIFRTEIAPLAEDRYLADDINAAAQLVTRDALAQASGVDFAL